ncbi:MAG: hypothetical protein R3B06_28210 [Kofleriaceae bacterium]
MLRRDLCHALLLLSGLAATACGGAADDGMIDAAAGVACGGFAGDTCAATEYCDFSRNTCGATDEQGVCVPRPTACPDLLVAIPTCGCDAVVYGSPCDAAAAGADLDDLGGCPVDADHFACGHAICGVRTSYCRHEVSDVVGEPDAFACVPAPAACPSGAPACGCLSAEPCGDACTGDSATGVTLTCPGG